jgi:hypothetical protein
LFPPEQAARAGGKSLPLIFTDDTDRKKPELGKERMIVLRLLVPVIAVRGSEGISPIAN